MYKKDKFTRDNINFFLAISVLLGISGTMIEPLIPVISEKFNIGFDKIGLVLFAGSIASLAATFISGKLCDRLDIKKIMLVGLFLLFSGFLVFGIFFNLIFFIICIIVIRSGYGALMTSIHTGTVNQYYGKHSGLFVMLDLLWLVGALVGPLVISIVLYFDISKNNTFIAVSFLYLLMLIFVTRIKLIKNKEAHISSNSYIGRLFIFKNPIVIMTAVILFIHTALSAGILSWLTTYFTAYGLSVSRGSLILSLYFIFKIISLFTTKKILKKTNEITIVLLSFILGTVSLIILSMAGNIYVKIIFLMLVALFLTTVFSLTMAVASYENPKTPGSVVGINLAFGIAGGILVQPVIGYIAEYSGKENIMFVILALSILGLFFTLLLYRLVRKKYGTKLKFK